MHPRARGRASLPSAWLRGGGVGPMADYVADHHGQSTVRRFRRIVEVTADAQTLFARQIAPHEMEATILRLEVREEARFQPSMEDGGFVFGGTSCRLMVSQPVSHDAHY